MKWILLLVLCFLPAACFTTEARKTAREEQLIAAYERGEISSEQLIEELRKLDETWTWEDVVGILTLIGTSVAGSIYSVQKIRGPSATTKERAVRREARLTTKPA